MPLATANRTSSMTPVTSRHLSSSLRYI